MERILCLGYAGTEIQSNLVSQTWESRIRSRRNIVIAVMEPRGSRNFETAGTLQRRFNATIKSS
jgi:hypothetical protein